MITFIVDLLEKSQCRGPGVPATPLSLGPHKCFYRNHGSLLGDTLEIRAPAPTIGVLGGGPKGEGVDWSRMRVFSRDVSGEGGRTRSGMEWNSFYWVQGEKRSETVPISGCRERHCQGD